MERARMKGWLLPLFAAVACYGGEGTLGGACERDADCGAEQACERQICSLCGDGVAQAGELCFDGPQATPAVPAGAVSFALADVDGDGVAELVWPGSVGLAVAAVSGEGFAAAQERAFDVTAVWSGDVDGDGLAELLTRDSSGGAALWRPDAAGELLAVSGLELEPMRGLSAAVIHPDFGIVGQVGSMLVRVAPEVEPAAVTLEGDISHLRAVPSLRDGVSFDVLAVTDARALVPVFALASGLEVRPAVALPEPVLDVATTRWNRDAFGDVAVLYDNGQVQVWLGTGEGELVEGTRGAAALTSERITLFDANADRFEDILAYGPSSSVRVWVRRGTELDDALELDAASAWWIAPLAVDPDPFTDLIVYDGTAISVLRSAP